MHKTTLRCTHHWPAKGKLIEQAVATTITFDISEHNLGHSHQWAYKKGHSTELLLVKMIEDWLRALDKNLVVGIVFLTSERSSILFLIMSCWIRCKQSVLRAIYGAGLKITQLTALKLQSKMGFRPKLYLRSLACHRDQFWDQPCFRCFATICLI